MIRFTFLFLFLSLGAIGQDTTYLQLRIARQLKYGLDTTRAGVFYLHEEVGVFLNAGGEIKDTLENISETGITVGKNFYPYNSIRAIGGNSDRRYCNGKTMMAIGAGTLAALGATYLYFFERSKHTDHYSGADDGMLITFSVGLIVVPASLAVITTGLVRVCRHGFQKYPLNKNVSILAYTKSKVKRIYN